MTAGSKRKALRGREQTREQGKNMEKTKDTILNGVVRHILTAVGGALVTKGVIGETELEMAVGALITIVGVVWSAIAKKKKE